MKENRGAVQPELTKKQRDMIAGMDKLLRRFNKYGGNEEFTVNEIIEISNEIYDEILDGGEENE